MSMLIEAFNGQIAPGVYATSTPIAATQVPVNLEVLDPLTRMLFYNC